MNGLLFFFSLIGLGLIIPNAWAADLPCAVSVDHPLIGAKRWYGLYYEDDKIGHAMTATDLEMSDAGRTERQLIVQRFSMTFRLEKTEETIEQTRRFDARSPHRLLDGVYQSADRRVSYEQRDAALHLLEGDLTRIWPGVDRDLCDEEAIAIHQFLESGPSIGTQLETEDFDIEHQVMTTAIHDLEEVGTRKILGADHLFQTLSTASSSEIFSYKARTRFQNGEAVNLFLGPIELRAETEAIAHEPNQGVDLFAEFEKTLNRPLARLSEIETLTLKASVDDPVVTIDEVVSDGFGQRVEYHDDRTAIIKLARQPAPAEEVKPSAFLRPTSSHPADHPRLKALIDKIRTPLGPDVDDQGLAEAILDFVAGYIENVPESPYAYHTTSIFDVLDNRTGDCTEHSQLFVTLARAAGLPAREVSGFVYGGNDQTPSLGGHAWVEVLIDGVWTGMDPTWEEVEINRSHVQISNTLVPSLAFEVLDITYH
ncbi:MAG: transglutaminase-like domain-containing protein [Geminicoccaceae bacterium]